MIPPEAALAGGSMPFRIRCPIIEAGREGINTSQRAPTNSVSASSHTDGMARPTWCWAKLCARVARRLRSSAASRTRSSPLPVLRARSRQPLHELAWIDTQAFRQDQDVLQREVVYAAFDRADVRPVQLADVGKGLLGDSELCSTSADPLAEKLFGFGFRNFLGG